MPACPIVWEVEQHSELVQKTERRINCSFRAFWSDRERERVLRGAKWRDRRGIKLGEYYTVVGHKYYTINGLFFVLMVVWYSFEIGISRN